jgi:transposase
MGSRGAAAAEASFKPPRGRPRVDDRAGLSGLSLGLQTGSPWHLLLPALGCGLGVPGWRRVRDWQAAGVWHRLHRGLLERLAQADQLDWRRAALDARRLPAKGGPARRAESDGARQIGREAAPYGSS